MGRMLGRLRAAKAKYGFRLLAGGPGAWQWRRNATEAGGLGIDCIFEGYFESQGPELFRRILGMYPSCSGTRVQRFAGRFQPAASGVS